MICTEQERDALMAAVGAFGESCSNYEWDYLEDGAKQSRLAAIRAMLETSDDAVVIPRELAERIIENTKIKAGGEWTWIELRRDKDAEALRSVLRGDGEKMTESTLYQKCPKCEGSGIDYDNLCDSVTTGPNGGVCVPADCPMCGGDKFVPVGNAVTKARIAKIVMRAALSVAMDGNPSTVCSDEAADSIMVVLRGDTQ